MNDVPESAILYAAPANLQAVRVHPGRVTLTCDTSSAPNEPRVSLRYQP
ncbi:MAG: hypothetical protein AB1511_09155 [Deinococcota bacterium]